MAGRKLFFKLYPYFLLVAALSVALAVWHSSASFRQFHLASLRDGIEIRAALVGKELEPFWGREESSFNEECAKIAETAKGRLTAIDCKGRVLFDSEEDASKMPGHSKRPEFIEALQGRTGSSMRFSTTLGKGMIYVAMPLYGKSPEGEGRAPLVGAFRLSVPAHQVDAEMKGLYLRVALGGIAIAFAVGLLSLALSRSISRPLEDMKRGAKRIAEGELDCRMPVPDSEEMGGLAVALNHMAGQLKLRLMDITQERNEREAILSSMAEGVIAMDAEARIIGVNKAAQELLGIPDGAVGRIIHEVVRNTALQNFTSRLLDGGATLEEELDFHTGEERNFQARGSILKDAAGKPIGALIVINDITRLRRLEGVRRDFVANVSHEIKTPITAIKGSVETLLEGAMSDPDAAERFLRIIEKHAERLNALVADILSLSSIESGLAEGQFNFAPMDVKEALDTAADLCGEKAAAKSIRIETVCPEPLTVSADRPLIEQAVVNLLDNAVKYSPEGSVVELRAWAAGKGQVKMSVKDSGCGIPKEHQPRLFERFYRVDKARSRKLGGTGLGLAIVKHIVKAHNGGIEVDSAPGKGSVFTIVLPV